MSTSAALTLNRYTFLDIVPWLLREKCFSRCFYFIYYLLFLTWTRFFSLQISFKSHSRTLWILCGWAARSSNARPTTAVARESWSADLASRCRHPSIHPQHLPCFFWRLFYLSFYFYIPMHLLFPCRLTSIAPLVNRRSRFSYAAGLFFSPISPFSTKLSVDYLPHGRNKYVDVCGIHLVVCGGRVKCKKKKKTEKQPAPRRNKRQNAG